MNRLALSPGLAAIPLLLLTSLSGCGTGAYEERLDAAVTRMKQQAAAAEQAAAFAAKFYAPAAIGASPVKIAVPRAFPAGAELATARVPGLDLPGLALAYGGTVADAQGGKVPYYILLGAVDVATAASGKLFSSSNPAAQQFDNSGTLYQSIKAALPQGTVGNIEQVQAQPPGGQPVPWTKIRATGEMPFDYTPPGGAATATPMPGVLEIYLRVDNGWLAWVAWRVPTAIEQHSQMAQLAPEVLATAQFQ